MSNSKYVFALVRFMENAKPYAYLSNDPKIHKDDVVIVPTQKGENYGIVEKVIKCDEQDAPYPPEKTKAITKIVGHKLRQNWVPEKPTMYVSNYTDQAGKPAYWIRRQHLFTSDEYECSYCKYCYDHSYPICPNCHKHMNGQPSMEDKVKEMARVNSEITAAWVAEEHLFGEKTYLCTNCKSRFTKPMQRCPKCNAKVTKIKNDPVWVDEMAEYDGDF